MAQEDFDLIIIGSGPGGYVAGIRAGQLGLKVAVVEKDPKLGGTCLHRGCIPTKALLHTASLLDEIRGVAEHGIQVPAPTLDIARAHDRKRKVVDKNARGIEALFKKYKVTGMLQGTGRLVGPHQVEVDGKDGKRVLSTRFVMIATGSVPRDVPIAPADGERVLNSDHVLLLERVPKSIAVLGAGAVGTEFASLYASFGSEVTLIEMLPRILPIEDEEVSAELERALRKRKIKVLTGARLTAAERTATGVRLTIERQGKAGTSKTPGSQGAPETPATPETIEAELLLSAVGRSPVTGGIGLEALGIELERGYVKVNPLMQTNLPHVYAIGDVVNTPWLAHVASAEGILAVEHMAGQPVRPINYDHVPSCTYCDPEVGSVGLSEARARERGYDVAVGKFPFLALGKATILGHTGGFVKVVRETKYDELLGVHIIGASATDLIAEACAALHLEATDEELVRTIHAHPTLSEAVGEAAHAAFGHAIHF
ncbi:MAG TPA: dihydrolipoyl dehydrogenase [Thermoanaerobaculia bacterium]|nr:dihydrolipoyl dehydrogenase [Thermoanaerobaculia bacterium]